MYEVTMYNVQCTKEEKSPKRRIYLHILEKSRKFALDLNWQNIDTAT